MITKMALTTILLVDDDEDDRLLLTAAVQWCHPELLVPCLTQADAAITYLRSGVYYPALLVTDLTRPGLTGVELVE